MIEEGIQPVVERPLVPGSAFDQSQSLAIRSPAESIVADPFNFAHLEHLIQLTQEVSQQ